MPFLPAKIARKKKGGRKEVKKESKQVSTEYADIYRQRRDHPIGKDYAFLNNFCSSVRGLALTIQIQP